MTDATKPPAFPLVRALLVLGGLSAVLGLAAWFGLKALGFAPQAHDAVVTLAVVAPAGMAGLCFVRPLEKKMTGGAAWGFLVGMVIRLPVCAAFVLLAPRLKDSAFAPQLAPQTNSLALWLAAWYFGLTLVEAAIVGRHVKQTAAAHAKALQASRPTPPSPVSSTAQQPAEVLP